MKKSKIILPAVALLTISTVAAASSTVAWFSANRTVKVNTSTVSVYNPESDLKVTLGGIEAAGTSVNAGGNTVNMPKYMRDGSVDAATGTVYKQDVVAGTYEALAKNTYYTDTALTGKEGETEPQKIYRATSWTMTFSMEGAAADDYAVLLNVEESTFTKTETHGTISKSFRIAFAINGKVSAVLAPFAEKDVELKYVNKVDTPDGDYKEKRITATEKAITAAEISTKDDLTAANGYIGTIAKSTDAAAASKLVVTCYAWFEGEDEVNCVVPENGIDTTVTTLMSFYAVRVKTAA